MNLNWKNGKQVLPRTGAHTTLMRGRPYHGYMGLNIEGQNFTLLD